MIVFSVSVSRYGSGNAVSGIRARGFLRRNSSIMVCTSCLVQKPFCSISSTIAAISHMFEMVASSMDMLSRLVRCSLMEMSPSVAAPVASHNGPSERGYEARSPQSPPRTLALSTTAPRLQVLLCAVHWAA